MTSHITLVECGARGRSIRPRDMGDVLLHTRTPDTQPWLVAPTDRYCVLRKSSLCDLSQRCMAAEAVKGHCWKTRGHFGELDASPRGRVRDVQSRAQTALLYPRFDRKLCRKTFGGAFHKCTIRTSFSAPLIPCNAVEGSELCSDCRQAVALGGCI